MARFGRSFPISTQTGAALVESPVLGTIDVNIPSLVEAELEGNVGASSNINVTLPMLVGQLIGNVTSPITGNLDNNVPMLTGKLIGTVINAVPAGGKAGSRRRRR